jgi:PilZ domain
MLGDRELAVPFMNFFKLLLPRRNHARSEEQAPLGARNGGSARDDNHNRRRVARVEAATPVYVYARAGDEPFAEGTKTVNVSVNGGCITLSTKISRAQKIIVTNAQTDEDLPCRVARSVRTGRNVVVGLEFLEPCPNFWGIEFETTSAPARSSE